MSHPFRSAVLPTAFALVFAAVAPGSAKVVGEPALTAACAKEAAHRLAMDEGDVLTLPTELLKGKYFVNGQVPREDGSLIMIECRFDGKKRFTTIVLDGTSYKVSAAAAPAAASTNGVPKAASRACLGQMVGPVTIEQVSPLRAGYHELIIKEKNSPRRVACTVSDSGTIEDWVEMN